MNEDEFIKIIGERIKKQRIEKQFTQIQLSDKLGIEDSALRRIESGRTNPTIKTLLRIANALDVRVIDLLSEKSST